MMNQEKNRLLLVATVQSHIGQFHKPLMKLLKEKGWEIHVAARNNLDEKDGLQLEYPDKVFDIPFQRSPLDRRNIAAYRQLKSILAENHYDVVHCNTPVGGILGRLAARKYRKSGTAVYYTAHGFHFYKGGPKSSWLLYYPIEKLFARCTDKLITINREDYDLAKKHFPCPVYRIHGVGADSGRYYPVTAEEKNTIRKQLGLNGVVLLTAGELLPNKNQRAAILALKELRKKIPAARLLIAGNGPEKENLEKLVQSNSLMDAVTFLGYTTRLPQYMQACDVFLSFSYREGLPLNILEAMLCGKPVVASNNRGHRELIGDGRTGLLVDTEDYTVISNSIVDLMEDSQQYKAMGINAQRKAAAYSASSVYNELRHIYDF